MLSKTLVCFLAAALMMLAFFAGSMLGGAMAGLPFDPGTATTGSIILCMLAKILLTAVFVAIAVLWSVVGGRSCGCPWWAPRAWGCCCS